MIKKLLYSIIIILLFSQSSLAESGTIDITSDIFVSWTNAGVGSNCDVGGATFTTIYFDVTDFNLPVSYIVNLTSAETTFPLQSDQTTFTITSGGTGSGYVYYYGGTTKQIRWLFTQTSRITSNPITVSYTKNIFSGMTNVKTLSVDPVVNTAQPIQVTCLKTGVPKILEATLQSRTGTIASESYVVTYPTSGYFVVNISKDMSGIGIKNFVNGSNSNYYSESSFNTNNLSVMAQYNDGIAINASTTLATITRIINYTGYTGVTPTPTAIPTVTYNPSTGYNIQFDKDSYSLYDNAYILYAINPSIFDFGSEYNIRVYDQSNTLVQEYRNLQSTNSNVFYFFSKTGQYEVRLYKTLLGFDSLLANDFTTVSEGTNLLFVNSSIPVGKNFTAQYQYGFTPDCTSNLCQIKVIHTKIDGTSYVENSFGFVPTTANTLYNQTIYVINSGDYSFELWYGSRTLAFASAKATYSFSSPTINIPNAFINTSKVSYIFGDVIEGSYAINDTYYSGYQGYIEINNTDQGQITAIYPMPSQTNDFQIEITNTFYSQNQKQNDFLGSEYSNKYFIAGNNQLNLKVKNNTHTVLLATKSITIGKTNKNGFGLSSNRYTSCMNDKVIFTITTPSSSNAYLTINDGLKTLKNVTINQSMSLPFTFTKEGNFAIDLYDGNNGLLQQSININVKNCNINTVKPHTQSGNEAVGLFGNNLLNFFAMPAFWGVILLIVTVIYIASRPGIEIKNIGIVTFIVANIEAIVGLFNPYTIYILVSIWLIAGVMFIRMGRQTTMSD